MTDETVETTPGRLGALKGLLNNSLISRLLREGMNEQGWLYAIAIFAMLVVALTSAATAWVMQRIIDALGHPENHAGVAMVSITVMVIFTVKGIANYTQVVFMSRAGNRIVARQQIRLYQKLMRQGVGFFNINESSDLLMRVTQSAQAARSLIEVVVTSMVRDLLTLFGLICVMVYQQPLLSSVMLIIGPLTMIGLRYILRHVRVIMEKEMASLSEIIKVIQETSGGIQIIKIFSLEKRMNRRMEGAVKQVETRSNAVARLEAITSPLMETLSGFAIAGVVYLSAFGAFGSEATTPGQLMSFVTALLMAYEPAKRLSRMRVTIESKMVGVRIMFELLDQPETISEAENATILPPGPGKMEMRNLGFAYAKDKRVLRDVNLTFEPGKTTALVGPSGAGKSTVLNLAMRLYDPTEGNVLIDGHDIRDVTFDSLRTRMSFVGQGTFLFSTSVMENIRVSRPDATDEEVYEAARAAHAHEFIAKLDEGYETQVGENGTFLSGGQRQRLSIARAFLRRAEILLLDEATSALDADSEALIKDALREVTKDVTTIVIAHRLSTVLEADRIYVMEDGRVVEFGTARELLDHGGVFKRLFDQQFGGSGGMQGVQ
ncbi:ABC transporter ATP-binding protein [Thioclava sp. BHET1]|nr:ABC transporter ATP-binding protein [Thioclava sp. BHET1]